MIGVDLFVRNQMKSRYFRRTGVTLSLLDGSSYDPNTVQRVTRILALNKLDVLSSMATTATKASWPTSSPTGAW